MTGRLVASGCSTTDYCWSTWADILGQHFDSYQQVGTGGADNATIARSIIDTAQSGDTVVIMWSSFDRWSFYVEEGFPMPKSSENHWRHLGSLALWDKEFFVKYYHPVERFQTTMDYIHYIDLHSKSVGYTVYHFSAHPFFNGEIDSPVDNRLKEIYQRYQIGNNYLLDMSLCEFQYKNYNFKVNGNNKHPTPVCHWYYTEEFIAPKLNIKLNPEVKSNILIEQDNIMDHGIYPR